MNAAINIDGQPAALKQVLLVDDEVLIRLDLALRLREEGFRVIEACNGDEALSVLQTVSTVRLVISDVRMPGSTDGPALAARVRDGYPHIKFILLSGHLPKKEMSAIADASFEKPVPMPALLAEVHRLLGTAPG